MEYRQLGETGLSVSRLGFGGAEIGFGNENQADVDSLLGAALDAGLNFIDTAAAYLTSETLIGKSLKGRRQDVILASKCGAVDGFTHSDWSKKGILETIERSLKLLQTDYLDLIQLHSCDSATLGRGESIEALIVAKERGYARFCGYSGDGADAITAMNTDFFDTLQTSISVADQEPLSLTIPLAIEREMGVIAKRPIANAVWRHDSKPDEPYHHEYWDRIRTLEYPFLKAPLAESIGTALRFTLSVEGVTTAIVGTTKPGRWEQNAEFVRMGSLDKAEFEAIRERWLEAGGEEWKGQV